jgi:hypothetical protein
MAKTGEGGLEQIGFRVYIIGVNESLESCRKCKGIGGKSSQFTRIGLMEVTS